jgi:CBS domain-containing protein
MAALARRAPRAPDHVVRRPGSASALDAAPSGAAAAVQREPSEGGSSMARVSDILSRKGSTVRSITPDATAQQAIEAMVLHNVGSIIVRDGRNIAGIFTERDFLRRVALAGKDAHATPVSEVMTSRLVCVERDRPIEECMAIMSRERIRHLPVVEGREVIGVISIGDLVKTMASEREVEVRYLTEYILGERTHTGETY